MIFCVICDICVTLCFFLNQQFITQSMRANHGSYFVTIYITCRLHEERNRRRKQESGQRRGKEKNKRRDITYS